MKKIFARGAGAALIAVASLGASYAEEVKIGVLLGFTGPVESMIPNIAKAAEMALSEASQSGAFLNGSTLVPVRGDSTCIDNAAATAAAERLITSDGVAGIIGADCSGVTGAVIANVAVPNGIVMISPTATSPALSNVEDNGLFFRTAPSAAREGVVMAESLIERGIDAVAITYTNNDYGKGLVESFSKPYEALGGTITIVAPHEDGKADYSAEMGALAAAGGDLLVIFGYYDQGGSTMIRTALDLGAFDRFHFAAGMLGQTMEQDFGTDLNGTTGQNPGTDSPGVEMLAELAGDAFDGTASFAPEGYDAAALMVLAMQAAGSTASADYKGKVMDVANAPGEKIYPGELAKALKILADGGEVDYQGASDVELIEPGEAAGRYRLFEIKNGKITTLGYR
ncbi:MAG TPA: branched-chain amino acid ABC transporter substrate-binding protein [Aliiroseovarius sp.]|nr:branched-chain amino acid ABC transporter substrate-binding protein [Aliiroseovarius sp.]